MGFTHLLRKTFPTFQRTLLHHHKILSQRFTAGNTSSRILMFQGNPRTFSSKTTDHHHRLNNPPPKETLVSYLPNRWRFIRQTLARASSDPSWLMERFLAKLVYGISSNIFLGSLFFIGLGCPRVRKERVPYTGRDHWVADLDGTWLINSGRDWPEKKKKTDSDMSMVYEGDRTWLASLGRAWEEAKKETEIRRLPVNSKESIRVQAVMVKLFQALSDSLRLENGCTLHFYGGNEEDEQLVITIEGNHNKKGSEKGADHANNQNKTCTKHLEKKWEVVVLGNSALARAYFSPSGNVTICSRLLDELQDDTELATIFARQIGCVVARHYGEISHFLSLNTAHCLLPENMGVHKKLLAMHPVYTFFSRRRALEADYIGLMLMAKAGYDPRVAPEVYPKLRRSRIWDYIVGLPSATKRRDKLQDPEVMGKALTIYREVKEGR